MSTLIAIDPGKGLGWAVFKGSELADAGLLTGGLGQLSSELMAICGQWKPDGAVIEIPQVYQQRSWKGDPSDLIGVAIAAGIAFAAIAPYTEATLVTAHTWKGNRPKRIDNRYTLKLLSVKEQAQLKAAGIKPSLLHNTLDAIGLGLWKLRRR